MTNTPQNTPAPDYGQNAGQGAAPGGFGAQPVHGQQPIAPQQGQPGTRYGTAAYDPRANFERGKPAKANTLHRMTILSLAIWLLSSILSVAMVMTPQFEEQLRQQYADAGMSQEMMAQTISMAGTIGVITAVVMVIVSLIPYILVLIGVPKGRNWARIVGIVFAILGTLTTLYGLVTSLTSLGSSGVLGIIGILLSLVFLVVNIYWLVLAFNGRVAAWFKGLA